MFSSIFVAPLEELSEGAVLVRKLVNELQDATRIVL